MYFSKPAITIFVALAVIIPIFGVEGARTRKLKSSKSSKSNSGSVVTLVDEFLFTVIQEASIDATRMSYPSILGNQQIFRAGDRRYGHFDEFHLESSCVVTASSPINVQCTISLCGTRAFFGGCMIYQYAGKRPGLGRCMSSGCAVEPIIGDRIGAAVQSSGTGGFFGTDTFITIRYEDDQKLVVSLYSKKPEIVDLDEILELVTTIPGFCPPEASPEIFPPFVGKECTDFTADEILTPPGARRALEPENYDRVFELVKKLHSK